MLRGAFNSGEQNYKYIKYQHKELSAIYLATAGELPS